MPSFSPQDSAVTPDPKAGRFGRVLSISIRSSLTLLIIAAIAYFVDWSEFLNIVKTVHVPTLAVASILCVADRLLMSYKWGILLKVQRIEIPFWLNLSIYSASAFVGLALPSTVGADALRAVWVSRRAGHAAAVTSSIVFERLVGFAIGSLFGIAGIVYLFLHGDGAGPLRTMVVLIVLVTSLFLLTLLLSFSGMLTKRVGYVLKTYVSARLFGIVQPFHHAYSIYRNAWRYVGPFVGLSILRQILLLSVEYVIVLALGIDVGLLALVAAIAVTHVFSRLPIAITDIGMYEGVLIVLLLPLGLGPTDVVAMSVVGRILGIIALLPATLVAFLSGVIDRDVFRYGKSETEG